MLNDDEGYCLADVTAASEAFARDLWTLAGVVGEGCELRQAGDGARCRECEWCVAFLRARWQTRHPRAFLASARLETLLQGASVASVGVPGAPEALVWMEAVPGPRKGCDG